MSRKDMASVSVFSVVGGTVHQQRLFIFFCFVNAKAGVRTLYTQKRYVIK